MPSGLHALGQSFVLWLHLIRPGSKHNLPQGQLRTEWKEVHGRHQPAELL